MKVESVKKRPGIAILKPTITRISSRLRLSVVLSTLKRGPLPPDLEESGFIFRLLVLVNIAGSSGEADIGFFAFFVVRDGDGHHDHYADHDVHEVVGDADQVQPVLEQTNQEYAYQRATDATLAAVEAGPAKHCRGQYIEFTADQRIGHHFPDAVDLHQPADGGHRTEIAIGEQVQHANANTDAPRRFLITTDGKQLAAQMGFVQ